jgi:propionate CoA-transferase
MPCPRDHKLCTADAAAALVKTGDTIASGGFVGACHPEAISSALERRFHETGQPRELTVVYAAGQGDGKTRGANHFAADGMLKRVIGGHWGLAPTLGKLAMEGRIEAYNFPQGVICQLFRDIAAGRPGCITHIGLRTFVDPIHDGGRLNSNTPEDLVERVELGDKTWLWYKAFPITIGLIRATGADPTGNVIMNREAILGEGLAIAQAVHNSGGIVIAQVSEMLEEPIEPQQVVVPGVLIDRIVVSQPHEHDQTFAEAYNWRYCTAQPAEEIPGEHLEPMELNERRIICTRACQEVPDRAIVNLGIGMPEGIARIAAEQGILSKFTLTVESGPIGGIPAGGMSFGASVHPEAVVGQPDQFDLYDGGGLDYAALGAAQIDARGNVNVSKFAGRLPGIGGFVNISQTAKVLVFCGTFTAGGLRITVAGGQLRIMKEGKARKFVRAVEQMSYNADYANELEQQVLYITERAVFALTAHGLELMEVAPGIDIQTQILDLMDFKPILNSPKPMAAELFVSPVE